MNRKNFILAGASAVAAVSIPSYFFLRDVEYDPSITIPNSLSMIWDKETIKLVGGKYIQKSEEDRERTLVKGIMDGHEAKQSLSDFLDQKIKQDFISGNTVIIDGWILSVTEVRQCALNSITKS